MVKIAAIFSACAATILLFCTAVSGSIAFQIWVTANPDTVDSIQPWLSAFGLCCVCIMSLRRRVRATE